MMLRRTLTAIAGAAVAIWIGSWIWNAGGLSWRLGLTEKPDPTVFYRVTVKLAHKGEPIDLSVVVGCGVSVKEDRYSGSTVEINTMYPTVYGTSIPGGHAVLVSTIYDLNDPYTLCSDRGTTANGKIRANWLPFIIWYDRADDLSRGVAYVTQDAYQNPSSQLEFSGAKIEAATRADFDAFMASGPRNLVPAYKAGWLSTRAPPHLRSLYDERRGASPEFRAAAVDLTPEMRANLRMAWPYARHFCRGIRRLALTVDQRAEVSALWPSSRPRFWAVDDTSVQRRLLDQIDSQSLDKDVAFSYATPDVGDRKENRPAIFPVSYDRTLARMGDDAGKDRIYQLDISIGDGKSQKGFMYCEVTAEEVETVLTGKVALVPDGVLCRIDGAELHSLDPFCDHRGWIAFQDDKYAFVMSDRVHLMH